MIRTVDLGKFVNFDGLADAILDKVGFNRTMVAYQQDDNPMLDYAVMEALAERDFGVYLAEAVLLKVMKLRKEKDEQHTRNGRVPRMRSQ